MAGLDSVRTDLKNIHDQVQSLTSSGDFFKRIF